MKQLKIFIRKMKQLKIFIRKMKWWLKGGHRCSKFCPTCPYYNICVLDEMYWECDVLDEMYWEYDNK